MKISFDNQSLNKLNNLTKAYSTDSCGINTGIGSSYDISNSNEDARSYEGQKTSFSKFRDSLKDVDVKNTQDYMTFMAHSVSEEDFSKMMKEGELPASIPAEDMVTIVDRIKLAVAKSGKEIEGYTDTLDEEKIMAMTGSRTISAVAKEEDVSLDEESCKEIKEALDEIKEIDSINDGMKKFIVGNELELTIDNLYISKHSACENVKEQGSDFFYIEAGGYLAKKGTDANVTETKEEVETLLNSIGVESSKENVEEGIWLVNNSLCVNEENIEKLKELDNIEFPLDDKAIEKAVCIAISEGKEPKEARINESENIYDKAVRVTNELAEQIEKPYIKATRMLEEVRLKMTTEANLLLLKSNVAIDTKDIEAYVSALKKLEESDEYRFVSKVSRAVETVETVKNLPASVIAPVSTRISEITLNEIADEGIKIQKRYEEANIAYECVSTEVRRDLGDSIKKAFRNVDEILESLGMEKTSDNQRAVRILGYNGMAITKESVDTIREADRKLQSVISRLAPSDTIALIREGKSPIEMSIDELDKYLSEKKEPKEEEMEKYSKFLFKLERDKDITPAERHDYIEVYRFLHQMEKTEDAALGSVLNAGVELNFENLRTAMKTTRHRGMDVTVGEVYKTLVSVDGELEAQWVSGKYDDMKEALSAPEETVTELVMNDVNVSAENLEAALQLRKKRGQAFKRATEGKDSKVKRDALAFSDDFSEETAKQDYEKLSLECKDAVYKECMEKETYVDVRALQLVHRELSVAKAYSETENFEVPVEIGGEITSINVKLVHNLKEEPNVVISFETEELGRVSARLTKAEGEVSGYIACNLTETVKKMEACADILGKKVSVVFSKNSDTDLTLAGIPMRENTDEVSAKDLYETAKTFLKSMKGL